MRRVVSWRLWLLFGTSLLAAWVDSRPEAFEDPSSALQQVVEMFESPDRLAWQKPLRVLELAAVRPGNRVVDLGAGTGYFTRPLSAAVGKDGKVYAVDTSPIMLDYIAQRDDLEFDNVETVLAEPDDPKVSADAIDLVLVVNTWTYIDDRVAYLEKLVTLLKRPSGRVAIVDWRKEQLPIGPPVFSKLARDEVVAEFEEARWTLELESDELPYQYFLIFTAPQEESPTGSAPDRRP